MSAPISREEIGLGAELIKRQCFLDNRGEFSELWNRNEFVKAGLDYLPEQVAVSSSHKGVLRGLHIQEPHQGKLLYLLKGHTFHVGVDLRPGSSSYGQHIQVELHTEKPSGLLLPKGFAHGFVALQDSLLCYFCDELHQAKSEWSIRWNDPHLMIDWPLKNPELSERDRVSMSFQDYRERK